MQKIRKILQAVPEKAALPTNQPTNQISKSLILGQFGDLFANISKSRIFFQKSSSVNFLHLQSPNFMQKIRKILTAVSKKTALLTNQPIIANNTDFIGPG